MSTIFIEHSDITPLHGLEQGRTLTTILDGAVIAPARGSTIRCKLSKSTHEFVYVEENEDEMIFELRALGGGGDEG